MKNKINYTCFYAARIESKLSRYEVKDITGLSLNRIENLEKGTGNAPTIEEIMLLENCFKNSVIKTFYVDMLNKGGLYPIMPRRVQKTSCLMKFIALDQPILYNAQIACVLECSIATAIKIRKDLTKFALQIKNIAVPPNGGIQTSIFIERYQIQKEDFLDDYEVQIYIKSRGK